MAITKFTIGADPEFLILEDGKLVSAAGRVGGSKEYPRPVSDICSVQEDNVALEITIPPSETEEDFVDVVTRAIEDAKKDLGYSIYDGVSATFDNDQLLSPKSREFGCNPDYDAFTGLVNDSPNANETSLRCCGGHIHVGYTNPDEDKSKSLVLLLDVLLGVPSILLDSDTDRRTLYGKASSYRNKDFGVEYRTLSNFWTRNESYIRWVYKSVNIAVEMIQKGASYNRTIIEEARDIINTHDTERASQFVFNHNITTP